MLALDHASLRVHDLAEAIRRFEAWTGLSATRTPGSAHHARLFFSGSYLELREERTEPEGLALTFLRFDDAAGARAQLESRGLRVHPLTHYEGVDGTWEELHLLAPPDVPAPILVKRILPVELARAWPPDRRDGALGRMGLSRVLVRTGAEGRAWYARLGEFFEVLESGPPGFAGLLIDCERPVEARLRGIDVRRSGAAFWLPESETWGVKLGLRQRVD